MTGGMGIGLGWGDFSSRQGVGLGVETGSLGAPSPQLSPLAWWPIANLILGMVGRERIPQGRGVRWGYQAERSGAFPQSRREEPHRPCGYWPSSTSLLLSNCCCVNICPTRIW